MDDEGAIVIEDAGGTGGSGGDEGGTGGGDEEVNLDDAGGGERDEAGGGEGDEPGSQDDEPGSKRGGAPTNANVLRKALRELTSGNEDFAKKFPRLEKDVTAALISRGEVDNLGGNRAVSDVNELRKTRGAT